MGRISEAEFFATKQPAPGPAPARRRAAVGSDPAAVAVAEAVDQVRRDQSARRAAVFNVDCGELAGRLRFVATRLRGAGWTVREDVNYRLVFLDYELLPMVPADLETR